jgi:hypothetical protein
MYSRQNMHTQSVIKLSTCAHSAEMKLGYTSVWNGASRMRHTGYSCASQNSCVTERRAEIDRKLKLLIQEITLYVT